MRSPLPPVLVAWLLFATPGCGPDASQPPAGQPEKSKAGLSSRLEAARGITSMSKRDEALAQIAGAAGEAGDTGMVKRAVGEMTSSSSRDTAASSAALRLASLGKGDDALQVVNLISSMSVRDEVLSRIAKGETGR